MCMTKKKRFAQNVERYAFCFFWHNGWMQMRGVLLEKLLCVFIYVWASYFKLRHYVFLCRFLTPTIKARETTPNVLVGDSWQEGFCLFVCFLLLSIWKSSTWLLVSSIWQVPWVIMTRKQRFLRNDVRMKIFFFFLSQQQCWEEATQKCRCN